MRICEFQVPESTHKPGATWRSPVAQFSCGGMRAVDGRTPRSSGQLACVGSRSGKRDLVSNKIEGQDQHPRSYFDHHGRYDKHVPALTHIITQNQYAIIN